jgi:hypothetical protein
MSSNGSMAEKNIKRSQVGVDVRGLNESEWGIGKKEERRNIIGR